MSIRDATEADLPTIVAIYNAAIPSRMATADLEPVSVLTSCTTARNRVSCELVKLKPLIYRLETRFLSPC